MLGEASSTPLDEVCELLFGKTGAAEAWAAVSASLPLQAGAAERPFSVEPGESVTSVAVRLQEAGIIWDAGAFRDYLIYSGLDLTMQSGEYSLSPATPALSYSRTVRTTCRTLP